MSFRQTETASVAAAKAGFSAATAYRIEQDPRLPSQRRAPRGRRRHDLLAAVWDSEVVALLTGTPGLRPVAIFARMRRVGAASHSLVVRRVRFRRSGPISSRPNLDCPRQTTAIQRCLQPSLRGRITLVPETLLIRRLPAGHQALRQCGRQRHRLPTPAPDLGCGHTDP
jgi:hypothetical protein